jgi:hypothetical protein
VTSSKLSCQSIFLNAQNFLPDSLRSLPWRQWPTVKHQAATTTTDHHSAVAFQLEATPSEVDQPSAAVETTSKKPSVEAQMKAWSSILNFWIKFARFCCVKKARTVDQEVPASPALNMELHRLNTVHHNSKPLASSESSWRTPSHRSKSPNTARNRNLLEVSLVDSQVIHQALQATLESHHQSTHPLATMAHQHHLAHRATTVPLSKLVDTRISIT